MHVCNFMRVYGGEATTSTCLLGKLSVVWGILYVLRVCVCVCGGGG